MKTDIKNGTGIVCGMSMVIDSAYLDSGKTHYPKEVNQPTNKQRKGTLLITIGNVTKSSGAWAKDPACEVSARLIRNRYHKGIRGEALIKKSITFKDLTATYKNKIQTYKEWSIELNISLNTLWKRHKRGDKGERLFREVRRNSGRQKTSK